MRTKSLFINNNISNINNLDIDDDIKSRLCIRKLLPCCAGAFSARWKAWPGARPPCPCTGGPGRLASRAPADPPTRRAPRTQPKGFRMKNSWQKVYVFPSKCWRKAYLSFQEDQYPTTVFRIVFLLKNKYVRLRKFLKPDAEFMNAHYRWEYVQEFGLRRDKIDRKK